MINKNNNYISAYSCQICLSLYNEELNIPIVINCGHTFCKQCIIKLFFTNESSDKCPVCKKINYFDIKTNKTSLITSYDNQSIIRKNKIKELSNIQLIPNYELISFIITTRNKFNNACSKHLNENLNFYCDNCKILICQMCLLIDHINHSIKRPENSDLSKILKLYDDYDILNKDVKQLKVNLNINIEPEFKIIDADVNAIINKINYLSNSIKFNLYLDKTKIDIISKILDNISEELKNKFNSTINNYYDTTLDKILVDTYNKLKEWYYDVKDSNQTNANFISKLNSFLNKEIDNLIKDNKDLSSLYKCSILNTDKNNIFKDIENITNYLIEGKLDTLVYNFKYSSNHHIQMIDLACLRIECQSNYIINIMKSIDRKDFVSANSSHVYSDNPLMIGWNTTISAPYMHMLTLSYLIKIITNINFEDNNCIIIQSILNQLHDDKKTILENNLLLDNTNLDLKNNQSDIYLNYFPKHSNLLDLKYDKRICEKIDLIKSGIVIDRSIFPRLKALDIGSGSGYMSLALSKMLGPNSTVYAIDHIEEIINFGKENIYKNHKNYLDNNRIVFVQKDGREGYLEKSKYDIIHVGAAVEEFPEIIIDQLSLGGYMWIPIGPKNSFKKIYLIHKDFKGIITKTELLTCSYAEMTSKEEQMLNLDENADNELGMDESF